MTRPRKPTKSAAMADIVRQFAEIFEVWKITLPAKHVRTRTRGRILHQGWVVWYLFGEDRFGEYVDYYGCHRMTNDWHERLRSGQERETLPTGPSMRLVSNDPEEDARLEAEYYELNERAAEMRREKGFVFEGDEPGGVLVNAYLRMGEAAWDAEVGRGTEG
jgi:hypothetical protein